MDRGGTGNEIMRDGMQSMEADSDSDETFPWQRCSELQQQHQQHEKFLPSLLPGIPDHITLDYIVTKLPWGAFHMLSTVSPTWRRAIQSRRVYDARVRFTSTETLVVHIHDGGRKDDERIAVYSMRDNCSYELPPIPKICGRIPRPRQCVSVDGKVYVFGGSYYYPHNYSTPEYYNLIHMFDLAGERRWKQCLNMQRVRQKFGIGVIDGKIYAIGGVDHFNRPVHGAEVYDPKANSWSPIASPILPMYFFRFRHQVVTVGKLLFVHGRCINPGAFPEWRASRPVDRFPVNDGTLTAFPFFPEWPANSPVDPFDNFYPKSRIELIGDVRGVATAVQIYDSVKDEWRVAQTFRSGDSWGDVFALWEGLFEAEGKVHSLNEDGIHVHDGENNSWKELHSFDREKKACLAWC